MSVGYDILVGDVLGVKADGLFHAVLCDPPYELGFMGKDWDASGVAFHADTWRKIGESLHPGGFLMAFASSRGWHRLACAIEDAGFIIHPTIFGWAFGSGFPKATRIDTQVDKAGKWELNPLAKETPRSHHVGQVSVSTHKLGEPKATFISENPLARAWAGHRYGLQALKPAVEPIIVAQKPYSGKPVDCITRTGAGALNVDGGRIAGQVPSVPMPIGGTGQIYGFKNGQGRNGEMSQPHTSGRWPANFILLDEEAAAALDRQSGVLTSGKPNGARRNANGMVFQGGGNNAELTGFGDTGGASRFFYNVQSQLDAADPIRYQAKASRRERDAGLEGLPMKQFSHDGREKPIENPYQRNDSVARNFHPTVKPIDLARYLATLLLPPAEYAPRRILVPFAGVGSEMIGAMLAGWEEVVGIEQSAEYADIARRRIEHWTKQRLLEVK